MPPRFRRRAGYRPSQLSDQLSQAIADEAQSVTDLAERLAALRRSVTRSPRWTTR